MHNNKVGLHNLILKLTAQVQEDHILCAGIADRCVDKKSKTVQRKN